MPLVTETIEEKQKILLVDKKSGVLTKKLKNLLVSYDAKVFFSSILPKNPKGFDYLFIIDPQASISSHVKDLHETYKKVIVLYISKASSSQRLVNTIESKNIIGMKVINLPPHSFTDDETLEKALWFAMTSSSDTFLNLDAGIFTKKRKIPAQLAFKRISRPRFIISALLIFIVALHLIIIPILLMPTFFLYKGYQALLAQNTQKAQDYANYGASLSSLSRGLYSITRPTYSFLSLALVPDTIAASNEKTIEVLNTSIDISSYSEELMHLLFKKDKAPAQVQLMLIRLSQIQKDLAIVESGVSAISEKIPATFAQTKRVKDELTTQVRFLHQINAIAPHLPSILAKDSKKSYLLLFANNMELRPGGGFIGSFGELTVNNLTIEDIHIYDVYDADGQLTTHIEPPEVIAKYLNQPHWFLRDSAFSPDSYENFKQAKVFLQKELGRQDYDGALLLTTTALEHFLGAFGAVYLPDFNESISKDNFYLKAQYYAENSFFPGSIQKKSFLGSLTRTLMLSLEDADFSLLSQALKKSLDEKQVVVNFKDSKIEDAFESIYWSGRLIDPSCVVSECVVNYVFPVEANVGVNKANFFVQRAFRLKTIITKDGSVANSFYVTLKNSSPKVNTFPGGTYKNYFQLLIPSASVISSVLVDGKKIEEYDTRLEAYTSIGFPVEVEPRRVSEIQVNYTLAQKLEGKYIPYQLIAQKQIGTANSDFTLEVQLPKSLVLDTGNFSPVVNEGKIFYNTILTTDKIFLMNFKQN